MFRNIALFIMTLICIACLDKKQEQSMPVHSVNGYSIEEIDTTNFSMLWWDGTIKGHHAKELDHRVYMLPDVYNESIDHRHLIMSYGCNPNDYWDHGHVKVDEQFRKHWQQKYDRAIDDAIHTFCK